jgi:hypothetical protein
VDTGNTNQLMIDHLLFPCGYNVSIILVIVIIKFMKIDVPWIVNGYIIL